MSVGTAINRYLARSPLIAAVAYFAVVLALFATTALAVAEIADQRRALAQASELLDHLKGRTRTPSNLSAAPRTGTPFLEGPTVTVAGAALLQRVAGAVNGVGGTVQSSQVDVLGTEAKDGFVGLLVSCEMEQAALQKLLYDLEAGMPFLFVDRLDVQVPQAAANDGVADRVRVVLGVSGQWQASK